ncbi:hypothetical protein CROQUDRAFT_90140 [Cronartium quercuum f. sp. fusiforme G11]|uniref:Uncharacterized protein n=1 Tax=Cronartium quercuum f. sp. fusiforme G11 TaxID=708437 RepID=A0A9P6NKE3_9BASI|nr:hypothetical protein CROQUDRAFT_90140 [Cronartium quercuum f. sp. fusiforme G11]
MSWVRWPASLVPHPPSPKKPELLLINTFEPHSPPEPLEGIPGLMAGPEWRYWQTLLKFS